ncbi:MAG: YidC/Oxa1 family membrane protein insertase [Patescibacteria group bacterium]|jgi:YidC/Oxa1 family membrane protein insertase
MSEIFHEVFYRPIFNLLIFLYDIIPGSDIGIAIILLTIVIKAALWPLSQKALRSQKALNNIQPKMEALKKEYANDKDKLAKELMALYSKEKVNPMSSCLPTLVQLPVFIALYQSLGRGLQSSGFEALYGFVANPGKIEPFIFGVVDLSVANPYLAVAAGIATYFQAKMMITKQPPKSVPGAKDEEMLSMMNKQMLYMMPLLTVFISWKLPGGLSLYWFVMTALTIVQQYYALRPKPPAAVAEKI